MNTYKKLLVVGVIGLGSSFMAAAAHATIVHFDFATTSLTDAGVTISVASSPDGLSQTAGGYGVRVDVDDNSVLDNGEMLIFSVDSLPSDVGALELKQIEFASLTDNTSGDNIIDVGLNSDTYLRLELQSLRDYGLTDGPLGTVTDWLVPDGYLLAPGMDLKITGLSPDCFVVDDDGRRVNDPTANPLCDGYRVKELWFETVAGVPEPGTLVLLGIGLVGLGFFGRSRLTS